jgi:hypothetical protein
METANGEKMDSVEDLAPRVDSSDSFLAFVEALAAQRERDAGAEAGKPSSPYGPTGGGWENVTIHQFLEAAVACARDNRLFGQEPTWKAFARFLLGGKGYE